MSSMSSAASGGVGRSVAADSTSSAAGGAGGIPKWVYALAIGVPVTAALLYVLFGPDDGDEKVGVRFILKKYL